MLKVSMPLGDSIMTMTTEETNRVVVFRAPLQEGNFKYWLAEFSSDEEVRRIEEHCAKRERIVLPIEFKISVGTALTLPEVMEKLHARNFQVLDCMIQ